MGTPREPKAAKYFVALLSSSHEHLVQVESDLVGILGEVDGKSEALSWAASKYYEKEMGPGLLRCFFSFSTLASPENLAAVKLKLDEDDMKKLDEVSALAPEYPGWMLARQGAGRRPADFEPKD